MSSDKGWGGTNTTSGTCGMSKGQVLFLGSSSVLLETQSLCIVVQLDQRWISEHPGPSLAGWLHDLEHVLEPLRCMLLAPKSVLASYAPSLAASHGAAGKLIVPPRWPCSQRRPRVSSEGMWKQKSDETRVV